MKWAVGMSKRAWEAPCLLSVCTNLSSHMGKLHVPRCARSFSPENRVARTRADSLRPRVQRVG